MTNQAHAMYALNLDQTCNLINAVSMDTTVLAQGNIGTGKSSLLKMLAALNPTYHACYFDCTTKDLGDLMLPKLKDLDGNDYVRFATNEELGMHFADRPIILMVDEYGKANPAVKNGLLRIMQERSVGGYQMHPDSLIFATTNLGAEGVGDVLPPHARNRIMIVTVKKPDHIQWIEWGINNDIDPSILGWVRDNPQLFQSFDEVQNPDENPYIFHPRSQRTSFVTPRSLEKASHLLRKRHLLDDVTITAGLMGTLGDRAAMDLMAFVKLADQLPTLESIKTKPTSARVPEGAAATCMVVYRTLSAMSADWVDNWMIYLDRLPAEAQGMFANGVRARGYSKQGLVMTNQKFTQWALANSHLFAADV